jgi:hypothetical protein
MPRSPKCAQSIKIPKQNLAWITRTTLTDKHLLDTTANSWRFIYNTVVCYATETAVQIFNLFYYKLNYNHL